MTQLDEKPAFEVFNPDRTKVFRIYASGRAEGFPEDCDFIMNRIPIIVGQSVSAAREHDADKEFTNGAS